MSGAGSAADGLKLKNNNPLPGSTVPTGAFTPFKLVINPPLGSFAYGLARSPVPVAGAFQFPGAALHGTEFGQKLTDAVSIASTPLNCNVPFTGDAIAAVGRIASAVHVKLIRTSLFELALISVLYWELTMKTGYDWLNNRQNGKIPSTASSDLPGQLITGDVAGLPN